MTHTGEKPRQCSTCDECFRAMGNLNIHLTTPRGEKPYPCKLCEKSFSSNNKLKAHIVTHTGEKPNQCSIDSAAAATAAAPPPPRRRRRHRDHSRQWLRSTQLARCLGPAHYPGLAAKGPEAKTKMLNFWHRLPCRGPLPPRLCRRHRRRLRRHYHSRQCLRSTRPKLWTLPCQG